jgi:hypothetical protein
MTKKATGIILIVVGLMALIYQGITYTTRQGLVDLGPIHATKETKKTLPLPPIFGVVCVGTGVVLLVLSPKA